MKNQPMISPEISRLTTAQGFDQAYMEALRKPQIFTQAQAFELVDQLFFDHFGRHRYADFYSYKRARLYRLKSKK